MANISLKQNDRITTWLFQQEFYHGFLPREDLPFILMKRGDYIVRTTDRPTENGRRRDLVLSLAWPDLDTKTEPSDSIDARDIKNIVIKRDSQHIYIDKLQKFEGLDELFIYYHKNPIKVATANAVLNLIRPVGQAFWEFKHSHIQLQKKVGEGAYGEVYKGRINRGDRPAFDAAIKTMRAEAAADEKIKEVMAEARLMRMLTHPNIVRIRGVAVLEQPLYIIIDYINGGALDSYIQKHSSEITMDDRNKMAMSAAWGIEFMHKQDILHRDIAARNCLYDKKTYVKLSDFGLSRRGSFYKMKEPRKMPTKWLAPESLKTLSFYRASDVYTYGILLYEIYTCLEPYNEYKGLEARKMILNGEFLSFEKEAPAQLHSFVKNRIYLVDHEKRATMTEVVKYLEEWLELELAIDAEPEKAESVSTAISSLVGQESDQKGKSKENKDIDPSLRFGKEESAKTVFAKLCDKEDNRDKDELKPTTPPVIEKKSARLKVIGPQDGESSRMTLRQAVSQYDTKSKQKKYDKTMDLDEEDVSKPNPVPAQKDVRSKMDSYKSSKMTKPSKENGEKSVILSSADHSSMSTKSLSQKKKKKKKTVIQEVSQKSKKIIRLPISQINNKSVRMRVRKKQK